MTLSLGATSLGVLPPFLAGTLALSLRAEFGFGEAQLGALLMVFTVHSAIGSMSAGRLVERIGAGWGLRLSLWGASACLLATPLVARSWLDLMVIYALGGLSQAGVHPASNMAVFRGIPEHRHGLAFGAKQAAIPAATLVAGLAVPVATNWLDWRTVFVGCAIAALGLSALTGRLDGRPARQDTTRQRTRVQLGRPGMLALLALASGLAVASIQPQAAFFVSYAVESGTSAEMAGTVLAAAGLSSIAMRILLGIGIDRAVRANPLAVISLFLLAGALGLTLLARGGTTAALAIGLLIGVALGWSWNGLLPYAVVRAFPHAPAAATAVPQSGLLVGAAAGPFIFGIVVEQVSYQAAWYGSAVLILPAAALMWWASRRLSR